MKTTIYDFDEYQQMTKKTAVYAKDVELQYLTLGLVGEAGEVANKVKKHFRGDMSLGELEIILLGELGDTLWYLARLADIAGWDLSEVATSNLEKLFDRRNRGVTRGDGDNR